MLRSKIAFLIFERNFVSSAGVNIFVKLSQPLREILPSFRKMLSQCSRYAFTASASALVSKNLCLTSSLLYFRLSLSSRNPLSLRISAFSMVALKTRYVVLAFLNWLY